MEHLEIDLYNDADRQMLSLEVFHFTIELDDQMENVSFTLTDLVAENHSSFDAAAQKTVLHVGNITASDWPLFNASSIPRTNSIRDFINASFLDEEHARVADSHDPRPVPTGAPKADQTFFEKSIFNIKKKLKNVIALIERKPKELRQPDLPPPSVTVRWDFQTSSMDVEMRKVMVLWNTLYFNAVLEYIGETREMITAVIKRLVAVNEDSRGLERMRRLNTLGKKKRAVNEDEVPKIARSETMGKISNNRITSNTTLPKASPQLPKAAPQLNKRESFEPPKESKSSTMAIRIDKVVFFNFNKSFFQTEILFDKPRMVVETNERQRDVQLFIRGLLVNDLTGYPFTQRPHELKDISKLRRSLLLQMRVPSDFSTTEAIVKDDKLLSSFRDSSLLVTVTLLSPELAQLKPEKVKTIATVAINNLQVNFYMQVIFRLLDLINNNILPFVSPDFFPTDPNEIFKRMTDFFQMRYTVRLFNTSLFLKPNYLYRNYLQFRIIEMYIANAVHNESKIRDLSGKGRRFFTEAISIQLTRLFLTGFEATKENTLSAGLKIVFSRLLFQREIKEFYGRDDFIRTVNFGNDIRITGESLHLSLFRSDFMFLMMVVFNNLSYDDKRGRDYLLDETPPDTLSTPMQLRMDVRNMYVYFRYDKPEERPKVWAVFELPCYFLSYAKNIRGESDMVLSASYIKASAFEIISDFQDNLVRLPFVEPILPDEPPAALTRDDFGIDLIKDVNAETELEIRRQVHKNLSLLARNNTLIIQKQPVPSSEQRDRPVETSKRVPVGYDTFFIEHEDLTKKALFCLKVHLDRSGNKTQLRIQRHNIVLTMPVFFKLMEFTRMTDEMSVNMKMQPLLESGSSNLEFAVTLQDILLSLPNEPLKNLDSIKVRIGKCRFEYNKYVRPHSKDMEANIASFRIMPTGLETTAVDHSLSIFQNSHILEKFPIFENLMSVSLQGVHVFTTDESRLDIALVALGLPSLAPTFGASSFTVCLPGRDTRFRFITYDLSAEYAITTFYSNTYKSLTLSRGRISTKNLIFALSSFDLDYFLNMSASLQRFKFDKLELDSFAQTATEAILLDNFGFQGNDYFYSKDVAQSKQRKVIDLEAQHLQVLLLDDLYGTMDPLLDLSLHVKPTRRYQTHVFDDFMKVEVALEASYLNTSVRVWEPIFENLAVEVTRRFEERTSRSVMSIRNVKPWPCINASTAMIDLGIAIKTNLDRVRTLPGRRAEFEQSMYHISNQTGRILEVWVQYPDRQVVRIVVPDGQARKIQNMTSSQTRSAAGVASLDIYAVDLEEPIQLGSKEANGRLREFTVNGQKLVGETRIDGSVVYQPPQDDFFTELAELDAKKRNDAANLLQSTRLIGKTPLITVSNPLGYFKTSALEWNGHLFFRAMENSQVILKVCTRYFISNQSDLQLVVRFAKNGSFYHRELLPNSQLHVPVEFEGGFFCVGERNQAMTMPGFSEPIELDISLLTGASVRERPQEAVLNEPESDDPHIPHIQEFWVPFDQKYLLVKVRSNAIRHEIILFPALVLENRTYRRLFITDADGQGFECMLRKHDVNLFAYFQIREQMNLRFRFANLNSETFSLSRKELLKRPMDRKVWVLNSEGWPMVKINIHLPRGDSVRLVFYHKNILLNETFRSWWFSQSLRFREVRSAVLQPQIEDTPQILFVKHKTPLIFAVENTPRQRINLDVSKTGPTFYAMPTPDGKTFEFTVTLESRKVSTYADISQNIVHFVPKYVFINRTKSEVVVADSSRSRPVAIRAQGRTPISFATGVKTEHVLVLKFPESEWSEPLEYTASSFRLFSVRALDHSRLFLVNLEINFSNNSYYIILLESEYGCCLVENWSDRYALMVYQNRLEMPDRPWDLQVPPKQKSWYSWRYPMQQTDLLFFMVTDFKSQTVVESFAIKMKRAASRQRITLPLGEFIVDCYQHGFASTLKFHHASSIGDESFLRPLGRQQRIYLTLEELGLSVIFGQRTERRELFFAYFNNLVYRSVSIEHKTEYNVALDFLAIDFNAKRNAIFPVFFTPKFSRQVLLENGKKFLKLSLKKRQDIPELSVFENVSLELHPVVLKVEEDLLVSVLRFLAEMNAAGAERTAFFARKFPVFQFGKAQIMKDLRKNWKFVEIEDTRSLFFQIVSLSETELVFSFRKNIEARQKNTDVPTYMNLQQTVGAFLINIDEFPLALPSVRLNRESKSIPVVKEQVIECYKSILLNTVFSFIASSNILGNPLSVYNELKLGVNDLMQKETSGRQQGVVGGTKSFMKHVVVGTSGAVNKFTLTVGDGLGALTTDNEYLVARERMYSKTQNKFLLGLKQLGFGIYDGIRGFFVRPVEGGQKDGFTGVMKGTYQGVSGLVLKPMTGMLDMAAATADGIKDLFVDKKILSTDVRRRPPRAFYTAKRFYKAYELDDAEYMELKVSKDGYQMVLVEEVDYDLNKLVVCLEGMLLVDDKDILWQISVEQIVGAICRKQLLTIEFFEVRGDRVVIDAVKVDYSREAVGLRIKKAIDYVISNYNQQIREQHEEDSLNSMSLNQSFSARSAEDDSEI